MRTGKLAVYILFASFIFLSASEKNNPKIGIALRGGGALGFAHIGALEVIDSLGIPISYVAGTSMGGLVGAFYSMGYSAKEIKNIVLSFDWNTVFDDSPPRNLLPYIAKENDGKYQLKLEIKALSPSLPDGLIAGQKIYELFFEFTYPFEGIKDFDHLPIPFRCVGADLVTSDEVIFFKGSLALAMRSTMSIPTVFNPVSIDSLLIIDGGVLNNFPTNVVKEMGSDFVIGLNLVSDTKSKAYFTDLLKVLDRATDLPRNAKLQKTINLSDLNINQNIEGFALQDFSLEKIPQIIARGKAAAYKVIDELLELKKKLKANNKKEKIERLNIIDIKGNTHLSKSQIKRMLKIEEKKTFNYSKFLARKAEVNQFSKFFTFTHQIDSTESGLNLKIFVIENFSPIVKNINISGNKSLTKNFISENLKLKTGQPFDLYELKENIAKFYSLEYLESIRYTITQNDDFSINLSLDLEEKAPQTFHFGLKYDDYYKLVGIIGFHSKSNFIPGLYAQIDFHFSGYTKMNFFLAYPSRTMDLAIYPFVKVSYKNVPWDIYNISGLKFIRYYEKSWEFGIGLGLELFKTISLRAGIVNEFPNIVLDIADFNSREANTKDRLLHYSGEIIVDHLDNKLIPKNGLFLMGNVEMSVKNLGSNYNYTTISADYNSYKTFRKIHTINLGATYRKSFESDPVYKTLFHIGGPETFLGWDYHQGWGSQFTIVKASYKINLFNSFYFGTYLNSAIAYSLYTGQSRINKPLWGYGISATYNSLLGPISLFIARADKSMYSPGKQSTRVYFQAGYKF